jgi:transcriptional regulator of acetoin/glycerol metabolism
VSQPSSPTEISTRAQVPDGKLPDEIVVIVLNGAQRGQRVRLVDRLRIGKAPENDLVLNDDTVSRQHCEFERTRPGRLRARFSARPTTRASGARRSTKRWSNPERPSASAASSSACAPSRAKAVVLPSESTHFGEALGSSISMRTIFGVLERIAPTDAGVLLEGETGDGARTCSRAPSTR